MAVLGATPQPDGRCRFRVWAPRVSRLEVRLLRTRRTVPLDEAGGGYHEALVDEVVPGDRYLYVLEGSRLRPDPASRLQPEGVHGPSEVVAPPGPGREAAGWRGIPLEACVLYELHVGAFTPEGTLEAIIPRLDALRDLGITVIELMPLSPFPGARNWGYDGVFPHAVHAAYGGPEGLRRLAAAAHGRGMGVALDVVYNHLGPEGNYLEEYGPYASGKYSTPWGPAMNFDGPDSDEVRRFFIESALRFIEDDGIDMLRVDAVHGIIDMSARPFLADLGREVAGLAGRLGRTVPVIAESDLNDVRVLRPEAAGGFGLDAQWNDDYHHALHVLLTGERSGYYRDFEGTAPLRRALEEGFAYSGQRSEHRRRRHGNDAREVAPGRFVVFMQNHDQVGNRMQGDRLSTLVSLEKCKLAAAAVILSPFVPLLFMGEEYAETAPFLYFVSHTDEDLVEAVRRGRREEFASFGWGEGAPDPQAEETFRRSRLQWELRDHPRHREMLAFHRELLSLRRGLAPLARLAREGLQITLSPRGDALWLRREAAGEEALLGMNFASRGLEMAAPEGARPWRLRLDSTAARWGGPGSGLPAELPPGGSLGLPPECAVLYIR